MSRLGNTAVIQTLHKISGALSSRRATSEALRRSERRFRNVVEGSIQGIIVHRDGVPLFANQAMADILGYGDPAAIMALDSIDEFAHPDDLAAAQERQRRHMVDPGGVADRIEYRCRRPDGRVIFLECRATVIDWDGEPAIQAACYDITEQKRAREEVRRLNEQLEHRVEERTRELALEKRRAEEYLDAASTIFIVLDRDGKLILANREACRVLGYGEDELIGKDFFGLCVEESERDSRRQRYLDSLAGDQPEADRGAPREVWVVTRSGEHRLIVWRDAPLTHDGGGVHAQLCSGTDITELRLAEDQLRQAHRSDALANLAGGIAHSLNNLLMPIGALTESALREIPAGERNHERLTKVLQASRRAGDLVSRILAFSRRDEPGRVPRDIAALLDETLDLLHDLTPSTITLRSEIDAATGTVLTDPAQLESVIMNLVTNAAAAIGDGNGEISISLRAETVAGEAASRRLGLAPGDYAHIVVRDNGPGIEPQVMQRIFDPFFTTKAVGQGTGLGLSIANSVVRQHGGTMRASSKPGRGATFEIYLPLEKSLESVA